MPLARPRMVDRGGRQLTVGGLASLKAVERDRPGCIRSVAQTGEDRFFVAGIRNTLGTWGLLYPTRSLELTRILGQILGLSLALLLFGSGMWANVSGGSLSQNKGAWVSHASR
jgi:hypothetical protein